MAETPQGCVEHQPKYKAKAWEAYTLLELGAWVHLLTKRAEHRNNDVKRDKDLHDAQNYLDMMQSKLREVRERNEPLLLVVQDIATDAFEPTQIYDIVRSHVIEDDELGFMVATNKMDFWEGKQLIPLAVFIEGLRGIWPNLFKDALKDKLDAEKLALHELAKEKHKRNDAAKRKAAGLDPRLPESEDVREYLS